jgi:hypothetical protein
MIPLNLSANALAQVLGVAANRISARHQADPSRPRSLSLLYISACKRVLFELKW